MATKSPRLRPRGRTDCLKCPGVNDAHRHLEGLIQDKCATCHAPMAWTEAAKAGGSVAIFGDQGLLDPDHPHHEIALEGVGCTLCHQIRQTETLGTPAGASGAFSIADADAADGRSIYGPYPDPFWSMVGTVDYLPVEGAQTRDSALCASCHDLETPYVDPLLWEPHHDLITSPDQVQVYEGILGTVEGGATYTLVRAGRLLKDNRLLPLGLAPASAPERIRPVGASLADDDFVGGSDEVTYRVDGLPGKLYLVSIELRDQALSYGMVRDLREHADDPYVARLLGLLDEVAPRSETIAEISLEVHR